MEIGNFGFGNSGGGGGGGTIGGGGTLNYIAKFTPDGLTINNSLLFDNGTSVGLGTITPDASAILELSSTTQGFATPRMTTLQRNAIATPVIGLLIYNTSSSFFNYWNGVAWIQMDTSTVTGADNGLNLNGTIVELGGNLIKPTVLNADDTNTLIINDSIGQVLNTRDASGNVVLYGFGGTTFTNTTYTMEVYSSGNTYIDSFIVLNFGSINIFDKAIDIFNMGSYCKFEDSNIIYQLGRGCEFIDSADVTSIGNYNNINSTSSSIIFGFTNVINKASQIGVFGYNNTIASINNATIIGFGNVNALSDEILIAQNDLGIRVDINGNVGIGVPYTDSINAKSHIKGTSGVSQANQRLEPVNGVYEDTTGATISTTDATVTPLETIPIPDDTVVMIESYITCKKTAGAGVGAIGAGNGYIRTVKAQNIGGVVTIGVVQSSFTSEAIAPFNATFAVSGTNIVINVTGALNDDVTWNSITKKYRVG